jgi:hypothetical protein
MKKLCNLQISSLSKCANASIEVAMVLLYLFSMSSADVALGSDNVCAVCTSRLSLTMDRISFRQKTTASDDFSLDEEEEEEEVKASERARLASDAAGACGSFWYQRNSTKVEHDSLRLWC